MIHLNLEKGDNMVDTEELYSLGEERDTLNRELGGGIPKSSIVLIEGEYGAGKSVMAQRFTWGFCKKGYTTSYITPELDFKGFLNQMESLEYDISKALLDMQLLFMEVPISSGENYVDILIETDIIWRGDVTIIDSFDRLMRNDAEFDSLFEGEGNDEKKVSQRLISFLRDLITEEKTVVLLVDPTNLSEDSLAPFRSVADVYFKLQLIDVGGQKRRALNVKRFSGMGKQVGDSIGYSVRSGMGLAIESREVI